MLGLLGHKLMLAQVASSRPIIHQVLFEPVTRPIMAQVEARTITKSLCKRVIMDQTFTFIRSWTVSAHLIPPPAADPAYNVLRTTKPYRIQSSTGLNSPWVSPLHHHYAETTHHPHEIHKCRFRPLSNVVRPSLGRGHSLKGPATDPHPA